MEQEEGMTMEERKKYRWQVENCILPRVGFKNADEVRRALRRNNCRIINNPNYNK